MKAEIVGIAVALLIFVGTEESKLLDSYPLAKHSLDAVLFLVSLGLLFHGLREPVIARMGMLLPQAAPAELPPAEDWLTLAEAARATMDVERDTIHAGAIRKLAEDEEALMHHWAYRVAAQIAVPVYGSHPMSTKRERVPLDDLQASHFRGLATRADLGNSEPMADFVDLVVKRSDLEAGWAEVERPREPGE